jgi:hypothetical protein
VRRGRGGARPQPTPRRFRKPLPVLAVGAGMLRTVRLQSASVRACCGCSSVNCAFVLPRHCNMTVVRCLCDEPQAAQRSAAAHTASRRPRACAATAGSGAPSCSAARHSGATTQGPIATTAAHNRNRHARSAHGAAATAAAHEKQHRGPTFSSSQKNRGHGGKRHTHDAPCCCMEGAPGQRFATGKRARAARTPRQGQRNGPQRRGTDFVFHLFAIEFNSRAPAQQFFYDERKLKSYGLASRAPPLSRQRRARFWRVDCGCVPLPS